MQTSAHLRNILLATALFILAAFLGVSTSFAQVSEGVELKPAVIEDRINPGQVYNFDIRVTNISASEKTFYLSAQDITGLDDSGLPIFSTETEITEYELSTWVELPESSITLGPNEERNVPFTVRVPANAAPGSHFGGVFLDARPPKQRTTGAAVGLKVGTIISLRVAGEVRDEAQMREFSTGKIVYGSPTVDFKLRVANLGNVLVRPYGLVEITDMRGSKVGVVKVNESASGVFPKSDKTFTTVWEYDGFAFGRYQAVASLNYGEDGQRTISSVTSFWVLPLKPLLITLGGVFGFLLLMYIWVRTYIARKLREMGGGRGGSELYARRNQSAAPKLLMIAIGILLFGMAFLVLLFLLFA